MSLKPMAIPPVPPETVRVAQDGDTSRSIKMEGFTARGAAPPIRAGPEPRCIWHGRGAEERTRPPHILKEEGNCMEERSLIDGIGMILLMGSLALSYPAFTAAQDTTQEQTAQEGSMGMQGVKEMGKGSGSMGMQGMRGMQPGMKAERQKMHEQMEAMHQEMTQELQTQLTALREHAKAMDGITDEKQLLTEMKKHQQMTDELLGTMVAQREKMHARMKERHEHMRRHMGKAQQPEQQDPEEHEAHHDE
jgi:hypothetical protein